MVTILRSAAFRSAAFIRREALIRGRHFFHCGYQKLRRLLEGGAYFKNVKDVNTFKIVFLVKDFPFAIVYFLFIIFFSLSRQIN